MFFVFVCFFFSRIVFTWWGIYPLLGASFLWFECLFFRISVYFTHKYTHKHEHTHTHKHTHRHTHIHTDTDTDTDTHRHTHTLTHTRTHAHARAHTHTHTHIRITLGEPNCVHNRDSYVCCLVTMNNN